MCVIQSLVKIKREGSTCFNVLARIHKKLTPLDPSGEENGSFHHEDSSFFTECLSVPFKVFAI